MSCPATYETAEPTPTQRIGAAVDTLVVRLLVGQSVKTWAAQVDGLAAAFGAHNVTIEADRVEAGLAAQWFATKGARSN